MRRPALTLAVAVSLAAGALPYAVLPAGALAQGKPAPARVQPNPAPPYAGRPEVQAFIDRMVRDHGFERASLQATFSQLRPS